MTREELDATAAEFIGKAVSVKDLYTITERVNKLYEDKGFLTCRAFLGEQQIINGVVRITLVEGRTGNDYSTNANKIIKGNLNPLGVKGHASAFNMTWHLPFMVDAFRRYIR